MRTAKLAPLLRAARPNSTFTNALYKEHFHDQSVVSKEHFCLPFQNAPQIDIDRVIRRIDNTLNRYPYDQINRECTASEDKGGDLPADEKHVFEIGGKGKHYKQIADLPEFYLRARRADAFSAGSKSVR